jgi:peptidoglycan/LPS O-acetylase OafA/YrhL
VLDGVVRLANARAVTIYLWQIPAAVLGIGILNALGVDLALTRLALTLVLTAVAVVLMGWIEDIAARRRPSCRPWTRTPRINP